jgi:uncharacterized SAM-binding protein YcdF (DUF218 family)
MDNLTELEPEKNVDPVAKKLGLGSGVIVLLVLLLSTSFVFWESRKVIGMGISSWSEDQRADCGVVLTGGPARIAEGFSLLAQDRVKKLIISGVHPKAKLHEIFPQISFYGDIDLEDVILEKRSKTTYGNAQQSAVLIDALQCKDMILVTSKLHIYRARRTFEAVLPKDFPIYSRALVYGKTKEASVETFTESVKSLFYSVWAY